jgi:hypothetical protein
MRGFDEEGLLSTGYEAVDEGKKKENTRNIVIYGT